MQTDGQVVVAAAMAGERLDRATAGLWPGVGLRGRRRLIEAGGVLVDGLRRGAAYRVRLGETLCGIPVERAACPVVAADIPLVVQTESYAVVVKPAGLHTAAIAHGGGASLEDLLPRCFPHQSPVLLSRLDRLTSGLVPLAFSVAAAAAYREQEAAGQVAKTYLAVVHGVIATPFSVDFRLDVADRAKTRLRFRTEPDTLRHTAVTPLETAHALTLVACRIAKGARHQIRAHLAGAGHPLVGDPLYGRGEGERLFLHCARLVSPVVQAAADPVWSLPDALQTVAAHPEGTQSQERGEGMD